MLYKKIEIKVDGYEETADLYTYILDNSVEMHPQKMRPVIVIFRPRGRTDCDAVSCEGLSCCDFALQCCSG